MAKYIVDKNKVKETVARLKQAFKDAGLNFEFFY